jgi:pimeloyl-ACP methyl ester carboxylesterase
MATEPNKIESRRPMLRLTAAEIIAWTKWTARLNREKHVVDAPAGDGHAVLVLPAFLHGDSYTAEVRGFLDNKGYAVFGWNLGINVVPSKRRLDGVRDRLIEISNQHGPVSIVGFSMGGLFARWLSMQMPDRVRQIITVCSPIHEPDRNFWLPLGPVLRVLSDVDLHQLTDEIAQPLRVSATILLNRNDGMVNFEACVDQHADHDRVIEIGCPHALIAHNSEVTRILAETLARPLLGVARNGT